VRFSILWRGSLDLPLYAFGVPLVLSLVWNVAALGMGLMLAALVWQ